MKFHQVVSTCNFFLSNEARAVSFALLILVYHAIQMNVSSSIFVQGTYSSQFLMLHVQH